MLVPRQAHGQPASALGRLVEEGPQPVARDDLQHGRPGRRRPAEAAAAERAAAAEGVAVPLVMLLLLLLLLLLLF